MKTLLCILLMTLSVASTKAQIYKVSGSFKSLSYHQGGAELPPEYTSPHPMPNTRLWLVEYLGPDKKPRVIKQVISDSLGNLTLNLPEGKYGFVETERSFKLHKGAYVPYYEPPIDPNKIDYDREELSPGGVIYNDKWYFDMGKPFEVGEGKRNSFVLTHDTSSICYLCP